LYWGISPEDAIVLPLYWIEVASVILEAENGAREKLERRGKQSGGIKRRG
jgi:hypothetical protein